jgi:AcrR family transcriptional regulator
MVQLAGALSPGREGDEDTMTDLGVLADSATGRSPAGQDARKRNQILDGARRLFLSKGFDASSMGDIAEEAGVSKGTLYVYFDSKERLFQELVSLEKAAQYPAIFGLDPQDHDVRAVLTRLGQQFARFITAPHVIMATRTVVAMSERMPDIAREFYEQGPRQCSGRLAQYLAPQVEAGVLDIDDVYLAAAQFLDMAQSTLKLPLLFGAPDRPTDERIDAVVKSAVDVFLAAYGKKKTAQG